MNLQIVDVKYRVESDRLSFPPIAAPTIRGNLGYVLRDICCELEDPDSECASCQGRGICPYEHFFAPKADCEAKGIKVENAPRPFIIEAEGLDGQSYREGDTFDFKLVLIGAFGRDVEFFAKVFEAMGDRGFGKDNSPCQLLEMSRRIGTRDYSAREDNDGKPEKSAVIVDVEKACDIVLTEDSNASREMMAVDFMTPFRFKYRSALQEELPFHVLVRTLLRRITLLETFYGDGEPEIDHRELIKEAERVEVISSHLKKNTSRRISGRQKRSISMNGLKGRIIYEGCVEKWLPLLGCGQFLHVGKSTTMGLGRYEVTWPLEVVQWKGD